LPTIGESGTRLVIRPEGDESGETDDNASSAGESTDDDGDNEEGSGYDDEGKVQAIRGRNPLRTADRHSGPPFGMSGTASDEAGEAGNQHAGDNLGAVGVHGSVPRQLLPRPQDRASAEEADAEGDSGDVREQGLVGGVTRRKHIKPRTPSEGSRTSNADSPRKMLQLTHAELGEESGGSGDDEVTDDTRLSYGDVPSTRAEGTRAIGDGLITAEDLPPELNIDQKRLEELAKQVGSGLYWAQQ